MKRITFLTTILLLFGSLAHAVNTTLEICQSFSKDTVLYIFNAVGPVCSASVNLAANSTSAKSFYRVVLVDNTGRKHLLVESFKEIAEADNMVKSYADETDVLDNITPVSIEVYIRDVTLYVQSLEVTPSNRSHLPSQKDTQYVRLQRSKVQEKVDRINKYNNTHEKLWTAGVTELSLMPFDDRMRVLGFSPSDDTGGFEYYVGGIFEVGEREEYQQTSLRSNSFVGEFDWTNRHGKNWMTSIKGQGYSNYCGAFAGVACVEALVNLYYNQKIDLNLSEQEVACCCHVVPNRNPYYQGLFTSWVTDYLSNNGVCDEASYPFVDDPNFASCESGNISPDLNVRINGYWNSPLSYKTEDSIKSMLIKFGPLLSAFWVQHDSTNNFNPRSHAMALVGYKTICAGDTIREIIGSWGTSTYSQYYIVPENSALIGRTYFKFKNSNNIRPNDDIDGYMHLMFHNLTQLDLPVRLLYPFYITDCQTNQPLYTSADVVCEDADGDGYYFWGLGPKPSNCPVGVPDQPDGDDSDPSVGPMDAYGNLTIIASDIIISSLVEYNSVMNPSHNTRIVNGGHLKIKNATTLHANAHIIVESGGVLTIDGGTLNQARLTLNSGSTLNMLNNGTINKASRENVYAPVGALVNMTNGKIN